MDFADGVVLIRPLVMDMTSTLFSGVRDVLSALVGCSFPMLHHSRGLHAAPKLRQIRHGCITSVEPIVLPSELFVKSSEAGSDLATRDSRHFVPPALRGSFVGASQPPPPLALPAECSRIRLAGFTPTHSG